MSEVTNQPGPDGGRSVTPHSASQTSIATVVICQGSWCRLVTEPGQAMRPTELSQASGYGCNVSDQISFRFANCLGLCGRTANAKIEIRIPASAPDETPTEAVFLKDVHLLSDEDWLKVFNALKNRSSVTAEIAPRHYIPPADPTMRLDQSFNAERNGETAFHPGGSSTTPSV